MNTVRAIILACSSKIDTSLYVMGIPAYEKGSLIIACMRLEGRTFHVLPYLGL